jgi:hypothetical protein
MKSTDLTPAQWMVLKRAKRNTVVPRQNNVPHGVYRSLVLRGLMRKDDRAMYELTAEGVLLLPKVEWP